MEYRGKLWLQKINGKHNLEKKMGNLLSDISKEKVDFGKVIGTWKDAFTGEEKETTKGMIIYSKNGTHVIPARP